MRSLVLRSVVLCVVSSSVISSGCEEGLPIQATSDGGVPLADGVSSGVDAASSTAACSTAAPLADIGEACCPTLGPDACGAHLFCASFDGRTIATCYLEHTRAAGETCSEDRHCEHGSCNLELGRCRAGEDEACDLELGCALSEHGERQFCDTNGPGRETGECTPNDGGSYARCYRDTDCLDGSCTGYSFRCGTGARGDTCDDARDCTGGVCLENHCQGGQHGDLCSEDAHCTSGPCVDDHCQSRQDGDLCTEDSHCTSGPCVGRHCQGRQHGDLCTEDSHCTEGRCHEGSCVDGRRLDPCSTSADCDSSFCNLETRRCGERCNTPAACEAGLMCTRTGRCVIPGSLATDAPCTEDVQCASGSCYPYGAGLVICAPAGGDGAACSASAPCADGLRCGVGNRCRRDRDILCSVRSARENWTAECIDGATCSYRTDFRDHCIGGDWRVCSSDSDCAAGVTCGTAYFCR
ncbi:MAG: hypothetical protein J0L92_15630 [Deltaproteobacteria bacterium]|nr:hypothetical protein [Deltaproteobacteria bacterium]